MWNEDLLGKREDYVMSKEEITSEIIVDTLEFYKNVEIKVLKEEQE